MKAKIIKILLFLPGLLNQVVDNAKIGSNNLYHQIRFKKVIIGKGCSISQSTIIKPFSRVFNHTTINNSVIESYSYIGSYCFLENVSVGKFCSIAKHSLLGLGRHPINLISTSPLFYRKDNPLKIPLLDESYDFNERLPIVIKHDVWIGARSIILDGVVIGTGAIIAAGAVVTKDVPPYAIVGGVPAQIIKYRFDQMTIDKLLSSEWWEWDVEQIKEKSYKLLLK